HFVDGAISEIDDLFGMARNEVRIVTGMTGVGTCRRVSCGNRGGHRGIADRTSPSPIADGFQLAVPAGFGKPHFNLDLRVGNRSQRRRHAAKRRQTLESLCPAAALRREPTRSNRLSKSDGRVGQPHGLNAVAWGRVDRWNKSKHYEQ